MNPSHDPRNPSFKDPDPMDRRRQLTWLIPLALLLIAAIWAVARMTPHDRKEITPGASGTRSGETIPAPERVPTKPVMP